MDSSDHRDFIWQGDYGEREPLFEALAKLLDRQNAYELGMCALFANNNPYNPELLVVLGYEAPSTEQITDMKSLMTDAGARLRTDVTLKRLINLTTRGRFNSVQVPDRQSLYHHLSMGQLFLLPDRKHFADRFGVEPLGKALPVFLSHSTPDKQIVEDVIPYLTRAGTALWYDKLNIEYGQSIVKAVQDGISESGAVIFFISREFLASSWCENEMDGFLTRVCSGQKVLILSVVFPDVEHDELPMFIQQRKYLKLPIGYSASGISNELNPAIRSWFGL
ncbi:toll/interleukin-1 receptor domain-containing protein [Salinisphaera hydrothermalis]|uniref:toll/interleukin-1 receptor domain-containing protein n=1 Tax=Salinisphaera hydrothermalis TaxID=563188 RepID=UPI00334032DC